MPNRPGRTREVAYMLTPEVERALVRVLQEVEAAATSQKEKPP